MDREVRYRDKMLNYLRVKLNVKTVDEDPSSCKRWISGKEIKSAKI